METSLHPVIKRALAFETYVPVFDEDSDQTKPTVESDTELEGDTDVEGDSEPNSNGLFSLTRCPTRRPISGCHNCVRLTAQVEDFEKINKHLIEGVEETSLFLQAMENEIDASDDNAAKLPSIRVLAASNERLLARNQELTMELEDKKMALKDVEARNKGLATELQTKKADLRDVEAECNRYCDAGLKLDEKLAKYKRLNEEVVKSHAFIKKEKYEKAAQLADLHVVCVQLETRVERLLKGKGEVAKKKIGCENGCVKREWFAHRELTWAQIIGLAVLLVVGGWDVICWLAWL